MVIDWLKPLDLYCERLGPEFWAEPFNAFSNIFMFAAGLMGLYWWSRLRSQSLSQKSPRGLTWLLVLSIAATLTGIGSFLFHTFANFLTMWGDILPIMFFMGAFLAFTLREIFQFKIKNVIVALIVFIGIGFVLQFTLPRGLLNGSLTYIHGVLVLLVITVALFKVNLPIEKAQAYSLARKYALCFLIFFISLIFRTFDHDLCESWPHGTHFMWHTLNGILLFLLIRIALFRFKALQK